MAATVSYKINGKYDDKPMKQALVSMGDLQKASDKLVGKLKSFIAVGVITKQLNDCTKAFTDNNTAQTRLFRSLQANTKMATADMRAFVKEIDGMAGLFGGDELVNAANKLANFRLNGDQMREAMQAAKDMAAAGIMPLDQAVQALGKSYGGNIAQLQKLFPELKAVSSEQAKNGKAVELLAQKYKGFEEVMKGSISGRNSLFNDAIGGIQDAVGAIVGSLEYLTQGKLLEPLSAISDWVHKYRDEIINFFLRLPEVAVVVLNTLKDGLRQFFSLEGLSKLNVTIISIAKSITGTIVLIFAELIKSIILMIKAFCENLETGDLGKLLLNAWYKVCNEINEMFFKVFDVAIELINGGGIKSAVDVAMGNKKGQIAGYLHYDYNKVDTTKSVEAVAKVAANMGKNIQSVVVKLSDKEKELFVDFLGDYKGMSADAIKQIQDILGQDLPEELKSALELVGGGTSTSSGSGAVNNVDNIKQVTSLFGDLGSALNALISSNWIGLLIQFIGALVNDLKEKTPVVERFLKMFSEMAKIINTEEVVEFTNTVLPTVMILFKGLANLLAGLSGALQPLIPVVRALGAVVGFIAGIIANVGVALYNIVADIVNLVAWLVGYHMERKSYQDISGYIWDTEDYDVGGVSSSSASKGSAASYTAAKDVYVTINYNHSYVNGDARDIAVQIYNEIKSASRMGVID